MYMVVFQREEARERARRAVEASGRAGDKPRATLARAARCLRQLMLC